MNRIYAAVILLSVIIAGGCKKTPSTPTQGTLPSGYYFVKAMAVISYDSLGDRIDSVVTSYIYDSKGRSTNIQVAEYDISVNPNGNLLYTYNTVYTYNTNTVQVSEPGTSTETYYIDATTGLADSSVTVTSGTATTVVYYYNYNSNGYRISDYSYTNNSGQYSKSFVDSFTISNGNIVQQVTRNYNDVYGGTNDTITSTFPVPPLATPNEPVISEYLTSFGVTGKQSSGLLNSVYSNYNGIVVSLNYGYTFDSDNRVVTLVEASQNAGLLYATVHYYFE